MGSNCVSCKKPTTQKNSRQKSNDIKMKKSNTRNISESMNNLFLLINNYQFFNNTKLKNDYYIENDLVNIDSQEIENVKKYLEKWVKIISLSRTEKKLSYLNLIQDKDIKTKEKTSRIEGSILSLTNNAEIKIYEGKDKFFSDLIIKLQIAYIYNRDRYIKYLSKGPPNNIRWGIWLSVALMDPNSKFLKFEEYSVLINKNDSIFELTHEDQIKKDIKRSNIGLEFLFEKKAEDCLFRILKALAIFDSELGYCQGMNIITANILMISDCNELETFNLMIYLLQNLELREFFLNGFPKLLMFIFIFKEFIKDQFPLINNKLDHLDIPEELWIFKWMQTLFFIALPLSISVRLVDCILCFGLEFILNFSISFVKQHEKKILSCESVENFINLFKCWDYEDEDETGDKTYENGSNTNKNPAFLNNLAEINKNFKENGSVNNFELIYGKLNCEINYVYDKQSTKRNIDENRKIEYQPNINCNPEIKDGNENTVTTRNMGNIVVNENNSNRENEVIFNHCKNNINSHEKDINLENKKNKINFYYKNFDFANDVLLFRENVLRQAKSLCIRDIIDKLIEMYSNTNININPFLNFNHQDSNENLESGGARIMTILNHQNRSNLKDIHQNNEVSLVSSNNDHSVNSNSSFTKSVIEENNINQEKSKNKTELTEEMEEHIKSRITCKQNKFNEENSQMKRSSRNNITHIKDEISQKVNNQINIRLSNKNEGKDFKIKKNLIFITNSTPEFNVNKYKIRKSNMIQLKQSISNNKIEKLKIVQFEIDEYKKTEIKNKTKKFNNIETNLSENSKNNSSEEERNSNYFQNTPSNRIQEVIHENDDKESKISISNNYCNTERPERKNDIYNSVGNSNNYLSTINSVNRRIARQSVRQSINFTFGKRLTLEQISMMNKIKSKMNVIQSMNENELKKIIVNTNNTKENKETTKDLLQSEKSNQFVISEKDVKIAEEKNNQNLNELYLNSERKDNLNTEECNFNSQIVTPSSKYNKSKTQEINFNHDSSNMGKVPHLDSDELKNTQINISNLSNPILSSPSKLSKDNILRRNTSIQFSYSSPFRTTDRDYTKASPNDFKLESENFSPRKNIPHLNFGNSTDISNKNNSKNNNCENKNYEITHLKSEIPNRNNFSKKNYKIKNLFINGHNQNLKIQNNYHIDNIIIEEDHICNNEEEYK